MQEKVKPVILLLLRIVFSFSWTEFSDRTFLLEDFHEFYFTVISALDASTSEQEY